MYAKRKCYEQMAVTDGIIKWRSRKQAAPCPYGRGCYLVFVHLRNGSSWYTTGCSAGGDYDYNEKTKNAYPVYAPIPRPEETPAPGQYACRRNVDDLVVMPKVTADQSFSCFCFTSFCQFNMTEGDTSARFYAILIQIIPENTGWVIVDSWGRRVTNTPWRSYTKPEDVNVPASKFQCGECLCEKDKECEPRRLCPEENGWSYALGSYCASGSCYVFYGTKDDGTYPYWSKGCTALLSRKEKEWESKGIGYHAWTPKWPSPVSLPGLNQWACRRNLDNHYDYTASVSCFCFTSNCNTPHYDNWGEFKSLVIRDVPANHSFVYVNLQGRIVSPTAPTKVPSTTTPWATTASTESSSPSTAPVDVSTTTSTTTETIGNVRSGGSSVADQVKMFLYWSAMAGSVLLGVLPFWEVLVPCDICCALYLPPDHRY